MKIIKLLTKVVIYSVAITNVFVEAKVDMSTNTMNHEETDIKEDGSHNNNLKDVMNKPKQQRELIEFKEFTHSGVHYLCRVQDLCNPGVMDGKRWFCQGNINLPVGNSCNTGWKECQSGCNPGKFGNDFYACKQHDLPVGNSCSTGWKKCVPKPCGGLYADCTKHPDCQTFSDMFCNSPYYVSQPYCAYGDQPPTRSPTKAPTPNPTPIPTKAPTFTPTAYPTGFLEVNAPCTHSSQCYTRLCKDGECRPQPFEGDCSEDDQCYYNGICNTNVKKCDKQPPFTVGALCDIDDHCYTKYCDDNVCKYKSYGYNCSDSYECGEDLSCNENVNKCDNIEAGSPGALCNNIFDCDSFWPYDHVCNGKCEQGTTKVYQAPCSDDDECESENCNTNVYECDEWYYNEGDNGALCDFHEHCNSYHCRHGHCAYN